MHQMVHKGGGERDGSLGAGRLGTAVLVLDGSDGAGRLGTAGLVSGVGR